MMGPSLTPQKENGAGLARIGFPLSHLTEKRGSPEETFAVPPKKKGRHRNREGFLP